MDSRHILVFVQRYGKRTKRIGTLPPGCVQFLSGVKRHNYAGGHMFLDDFQTLQHYARSTELQRVIALAPIDDEDALVHFAPIGLPPRGPAIARKPTLWR